MTNPLGNHVSALLGDGFLLPIDRPFTTAEARQAGVSPNQLTQLVRQELLRRVLRGVYVAAQVEDTQELRGRALSLVVPPGSVAVDWTACWYWTGVDRPNAHLEIPQLSVFRFRGRGRLRNPLVSSGQRWLLRADVVPVTGDLLVTTAIRTAWDLGRFAPAITAIGGMDALARSGSFDVPELVAGVERFRRQRGVVQLRWLAPLVDGRAESPGESSLRLRWLETGGMPRPELQIPVHSLGAELFRLDLGVEEIRFAAEYDGQRWHDEETAPADEARREQLREEFRWVVEVFRREHVYGTHQDAGTRLLRGVEQARRQLGRFRPR